METSETQQLPVTKVAFLFPGQGTQSVGMGKTLYEESPAAREVLDEIDDALDLRITQLMFNGPEQDLSMTLNAQPAIFASSLACLAAMKEMNKRFDIEVSPAFVAGHSLGEYTALVASNVLTVRDAARLIRERGRLMQNASNETAGGLAAVIGLDELTVEEVCRETGTNISTVNSLEQVVIGGSQVALARAMDLCSARGAKKLVRLQVSGAFHTNLMAPAAEGLAQAIHGVKFNDPSVPVVANCSGHPLNTKNSARKELMRQLCNCVHWRRSMDYLSGAGVNVYYEIGPGKVLTGLAKRSNPDAVTVTVNDMETVKALAG